MPAETTERLPRITIDKMSRTLSAIRLNIRVIGPESIR
jgi:hypothetical protein